MTVLQRCEIINKGLDWKGWWIGVELSQSKKLRLPRTLEFSVFQSSVTSTHTGAASGLHCPICQPPPTAIWRCIWLVDHQNSSDARSGKYGSPNSGWVNIWIFSPQVHREKKHVHHFAVLYFYSATALSFGSNNLQRKLHCKISVWVPSFSRVDSSWASCFIPHPSVPSVFARRKNDTKDENVSGFDLDGRNAEFAEASLFFAAAQSTDCGLYRILSRKLRKGPTTR